MNNLQIEGDSLEWLLGGATDAMLIIDQAGRIVLANAALERLFGLSQQEILGQTMEVLLPPHLRHGHVRLRSDYFDQPRARKMGSGSALSGMHRDGREFPVEVSLSPLHDAQGQPLVLATILDITQRKAAEAALQESEARMRAIFETAVDAIITIDDHGIVERMNMAAQHMFGYSEAEVAGRNVSMLMPMPHSARHDGYLANYLRSGEKKIIGKGREAQGLRKDGSLFPMDLAVAEMWLGERRMFTGVVRDITRNKAAEQDLKASQEALRRLAAHQENIKEQERKRIAQEIHDELGGLLTGIKAYISVAIERSAASGAPADPLLDDAAALAQDAIGTVRRVITDLRPSVLDQLGVWAALEWYAGQVAQRSGLDCRCSIAAQVAALELDPERSTMLFRVVQEALTNVQRHAQARTVRIEAVLDQGALLLTVADDGQGIAPERMLGGDSWGILGMHERSRHFGGQLKLGGAPGQGTTLQLRLPLEGYDGN